MASHATNHAEIARRGEPLYDSEIRPIVEPVHNGEFVVIDIDSADFEVDLSEVVAVRRMADKRPEGRRYIKRVGHSAAHRLGGRFIPRQP